MRYGTGSLVFFTTLGLALCAVTGPAAADASRQETIGLGTGAAVGAAAAGPVGFMVGAAVGAKLGNVLHLKDETNDRLSGELVAARGELAELEARLSASDSDLREIGARLEALVASGAPQVMELMETGIEMDLLFRTEADTLGAETAARIDEFARVLAGLPSVRIRLDAWADPRGEEAYNQALSERRAEHVRALLTAAGIPGTRVTTMAHGESDGIETDPDRNALDRRVSVTLYIPEEDERQIADSRAIDPRP